MNLIIVALCVSLAGCPAEMVNCYVEMPKKPEPCIPKKNNKQEYIECILKDNDALRTYARRIEYLVDGCGIE